MPCSGCSALHGVNFNFKKWYSAALSVTTNYIVRSGINVFNKVFSMIMRPTLGIKLKYWGETVALRDKFVLSVQRYVG